MSFYHVYSLLHFYAAYFTSNIIKTFKCPFPIQVSNTEWIKMSILPKKWIPENKIKVIIKGRKMSDECGSWVSFSTSLLGLIQCLHFCKFKLNPNSILPETSIAIILNGTMVNPYFFHVFLLRSFQTLV